jgi:hypothetical protein
MGVMMVSAASVRAPATNRWKRFEPSGTDHVQGSGWRRAGESNNRRVCPSHLVFPIPTATTASSTTTPTSTTSPAAFPSAAVFGVVAQRPQQAFGVGGAGKGGGVVAEKVERGRKAIHLDLHQQRKAPLHFGAPLDQKPVSPNSAQSGVGGLLFQLGLVPQTELQLLAPKLELLLRQKVKPHVVGDLLKKKELVWSFWFWMVYFDGLFWFG